jgi:UDP-glucose 4-epimerase
MIFASSQGVYGIPESLPVKESHSRNPSDFYSLTKLQGEILCEYYARNYDFHTIVLRFAGIYGMGKNKGAIYNFTTEVLNGKSPQIFSDGNQTRDFVYIEDVVNATINALNITDEIAFDVFNVGSGRETSINELLGMIIKIADRDIDFKYAPEKSTDRFVLDITKAKKHLYYHPHSLDSGLEEFIGLIKYGGNV